MWAQTGAGRAPIEKWLTVSQAKLNVVRHFESLEFHYLDEFSLDRTANPVLLTESGIFDAVGVSVRTEVASKGLQLRLYLWFPMEVVSGEKVSGNIDDNEPNARGMATVSIR